MRHLPVMPSLILKIWFDVDQTSAQLDHTIERARATPKSTPDPEPKDGKHAGSIYFETGETLGLQVIGSGTIASKFTSFQIIDCHIISRPQIIQCGTDVTTKYAAPSPFLQAVGPCHKLDLNNFSATRHTVGHTELVITQDWGHTLQVGHARGRWDLSFMLTVRILRDPGAVEDVRVLWFDPESEVGTAGTLKNQASEDDRDWSASSREQVLHP